MSTSSRDPTMLDPLTGTPTSKAEQVVRMVTADWDHRTEDLGRLLDAAMAGLADRAKHELRQVLAQLSTDLELLRRNIDPDEATEQRIERMLTAIDRASSVVGTHLDRNEAAKLIIQLHPHRFDLTSTIEALIERLGLPQECLELTMAPAQIEGDRDKLASVLEYLLERCHRAAPPGACVHISLEANGDHVEGLIGLDPGPEARETLIGELEEPLDIEAYGLDLPYSRAVVERHGGTLYVHRFGDEGLGFGFRLPIDQDRIKEV